ncbi:MAG: cysteine desulfurase [Armatimonadetes bacterium]|nr:MAG: cysteine desulfurase [Armatimonadota bacterium]
MKICYFDNAASTAVDPRVFEAMRPWFCESYANPSALHAMAQQAKQAIEEAREAVAELLGAEDPDEIIFTSGATEGNNAVLNTFPGRLLVSAIEHPSVRVVALETGRAELIPVDKYGTVLMSELERLLQAGKTDLVSVMLVNNEIGSVQDIEAIGHLAHKYGAYFHTDLTQAVGKGPLNLGGLPVDYASLSAHKFHGPKGVGALYVRTGVPFKPYQKGGSHEKMRRAGTLNTPGIVGLGAAARIVIQEGEQESTRLRAMRDRIRTELAKRVPDAVFNGQPDGAPHVVSVSFPGLEAESLIINLDSRGIYCTAGAACSSGKKANSPVLEAIGLPQEVLAGTVRISLGRFNTEEEVDYLIENLVEALAEVRGLRPSSV